MKLTIRTDIIESLNNVLKNDYEHNIRFLFGKKTRCGFTSFFNRWDYQCVLKSLENSRYTNSKKRICSRTTTEICDIGFVTHRNIILGTVKEEAGEEIQLTIFNVEKYNIIFIQIQPHNYQIEIELLQKPQTLTELFEPVKYLYSLILDSYVTVNETSNIIQEYNTLLGKKQDTAWIVPQGLQFLDQKSLMNIKKYVVMPMRIGEKYMLYLSKQGAYLISKREILFVVNQVPQSLYNTIVMGEWNENQFTGYDIVRIGDLDMRKKSLLHRLKKLRIVSIRFPFCKTVCYYSSNLGKHTEELLQIYEGVIYAPIYANYMNNRVYLYQPVENVGIKFKIDSCERSGFTIFSIKTDVLFTGTDFLPYESHIPISRDDREFIGPINNTVFEFRWESNGLMPYILSHKNQISTDKFARQAWTYINNPLEKQLVIRIFKKESYTS